MRRAYGDTAARLLFVMAVLCSCDSHVRIVPARVVGGKTAWILVRANPKVPVSIQVESGTECGNVSPENAQTNDKGEAKVVFTAFDPPAECDASIKALIAPTKDVSVTAPGAQQIIKRLQVVPSTPVAAPTVDTTSVITMILIASFAIDRFVTLLLWVVPITKRHGERDRTRAERLTYVVLAGTVGLFLGYFGEIRLLEALGFSPSVPLNAIVTALVLAAGSDSISTLLAKIGRGPAGEVEPKPVIVQGELQLKRADHSRGRTVQGGSADQPPSPEDTSS